MGCYNTYAGVQIKVGPRNLDNFEIGDKVPLEDGIYVGWGGAIVVKDSILIAFFEYIKDKWGGIHTVGSIIDSNYYE